MYYVWRSDSPAGAVPFDRLEDGHRAMRRAMAACHDRTIEWCLVHDPGGTRDWETVVCGRHGDLI